MMKKILIADDEEGIRLVLAATLCKQFSIVQACDGLQALAMARLEKPDVILLDIAMPGMDGLETLARIKAEKLGPVAIIMLSSMDDMETVGKALAMGACEYITKPFDPHKVRRVIADKVCMHKGGSPWVIKR
jgi:CheY-like chemotaxis protein